MIDPGSTPGPAPGSGPQAGPAGPTRLVGLLPEEIGVLPALAGSPGYRTRQVAVWVYQKGATDFEEMTTLSKPLRAGLAGTCSLERMPCVATRVSADATAVKFLFATPDGRHIEAVLLRAPRRDTICISTQVGCAFGCRFCATAAMGWRRNLTRHEIVSQALALRDELRRLGSQGFFNVVFMGMGEPLANYGELVATLHVMQSDFGMGIGRRRMTVSTVGLPDEIRQLAREPVSVRLALSLNATDDETRSRLMPVNRRHPIETLLPALAEYRALTGQRVTLEYILLHELNDTQEDARRLARIATRVGCGINLIRYNPHPLSEFQPSTPERVEAFRRTLLPIAPAVTLRESRGEDILAACGQLSTAYACGDASGGTPAPA